MNFIRVQGHGIEYEFIRCADNGKSVIVFLHEGLGSVAAWKDFPARVVEATGHAALVYSRYGYGQSDALTSRRQVNYLHEEALTALPELLDRLEVRSPILLGHSDGASIALIHAGGSQRAVTGVIAMAPHVMVEDIAVTGILATRRSFEGTDLRDRLGRYHANPDSAFRGWSDIWLDQEFRPWNIEEFLPRIVRPVLAIQGENDEYATMQQIDRIAQGAPDVQLLKLGTCGHSPHRDQPEAVIAAVRRFVERISV